MKVFIRFAIVATVFISSLLINSITSVPLKLIVKANIQSEPSHSGSSENLKLTPQAAASGNVVWYVTSQTSESNLLYIQPRTYNTSLLGAIGIGANQPQPKWHIDQWNIPSQLPVAATPTPSTTDGNSWMTANAHARVIKYDEPCNNCSFANYQRSKRIELGQNGAALPCGVEFDNFLEPNDAQLHVNYPAGFLRYSITPPISELSSLVCHFTASNIYEAVTTRCINQGKVDYGFLVLGVVLNNTSSNQTLFYQVILRDTRPSFYANGASPGSFYYFTGVNEVGTPGIYGVNDTAGVFGRPSLAPGMTIDYTLDIASQVKRNIQNGPSTLNKDLTKWKVASCYIGSGVEGSTVITSQYWWVYMYGVLA